MKVRAATIRGGQRYTMRTKMLKKCVCVCESEKSDGGVVVSIPTGWW